MAVSQATLLQAAKQGIQLDPLTGRNLGTIFSPGDPSQAAGRETRQNFAFAESIGGTTEQLGLTGPGTSTFLRPEQLAALIALQRGGDTPATLSQLAAGEPISAAPFASAGSPLNFGGGGFFGSGATAGGSSGLLGGLRLSPVVIGAAAVAAFLLLRR